MSIMTKVFIVLTAVLSIAVSCLFIAAAAQWTNWRGLAEGYQRARDAAFVERMNLEATMRANAAMLEDSLRDVSRSRDTAEKEKQDLLNQLADAKNDLARRTNEAVAADADRKTLTEIVSVQTGELTALQKRNEVLLTQNQDLQTRNSRLNSRVLELTSTATIQNDQIRNLQEKLYAMEQQLAQSQAGARRTAARGEAAPGVVPQMPLARGPILGQITDVSENYASVNVGESAGVAPGMTFTVHRGDTFLAELVIDRVRPSEAGGKLRIVQQPVRAGDQVAYGWEGTED